MSSQPMRVWPGVVAVILQWTLWMIIPLFNSDFTAYGMIGGILGGGLTVLIWWLFFSRAPQVERWIALAAMVGVAFAMRPLLDASVAGGMMNMMFTFFVIPTMCLALVGWAVLCGRLAGPARYVTLAVAIVLGAGFWTVMRTDGITGEGHSQLAFRWAKTPEQKLLSAPNLEPAPLPPAPHPEKPVEEPAPAPAARAIPVSLPKPAAPKPHPVPEWPGFRGKNRDDIVAGLKIRTDWASAPPAEMWRHPVGPGWSSFAVGGGLIYTQEQRGDFEVVSCWRESNGKPVWTHRDAARFYESNGGAGPRGTPALHEGRVYTMGATGIVNALDADTGAVIWTRNAQTDTGAKLPGWAFAASPLVVGDALIVAASGRLIAYDLSTGNPRWQARGGGAGYSSPHLMTIGGVPQILFMNGGGVLSVAPADGKVLWKHEWPGAAMLQPAAIPDGGVLITNGDMTGGMGTRRLDVTRGPDGWTAKELWTSQGLKPYFNDIVVHNGHAYGFDGGILSCIDLQDGHRLWKGGRYGHGQLVLLADQDLMIVLTEEGELALVSATPDKFNELVRIPSMDGKTWNHFAVAGTTLLVRNGQEMVAYRLPVAGG